MIGSPPPAELAGDRPAIAAWYWRQIETDECVETHDDPESCEHVQDLITGAIEAGVVAVQVPVGDGVSVPLHQLLAPYRTVPGGLAEQEEAGRRRTLDVPGRAGRARGWSW